MSVHRNPSTELILRSLVSEVEWKTDQEVVMIFRFGKVQLFKMSSKHISERNIKGTEN